MKNKLLVLFISMNMLNVLDKTVTWFALKNPDNFELNPLVRSVIEKLGLDMAMVLYSLFGFALIYITYRVVIMKRLTCEKNNISPEMFFLMLNTIFFFIVVNNIFWAFYKM